MLTVIRPKDGLPEISQSSLTSDEIAFRADEIWYVGNYHVNGWFYAPGVMARGPRVDISRQFKHSKKPRVDLWMNRNDFDRLINQAIQC